MASATQRKVVRVHRQAMDMLSVVRHHLQRFPQDSALFAIDFERALRDLGFDLSRGMREHLLERLPRPVPGGGELYEAVKEGRVALPAQIGIRLGPPPNEQEAVGLGTGDLDAPISREVSVLPANAAPAIARRVPPKPGTGGYSVLVQLTDNIINRIIGVAYDQNLIPHHWSGSYQADWPVLQVEIDADYDVDVQKPAIDFDTTYDNGVALNLAATAKLKLTFSYLDFPSGTVPSLSDKLTVDVKVTARAVGTAEIRTDASGKAAVYLNLKDLQNLDLQISGAAVPPLVEELVRAAIERIAQTELADIKLPLTFGFDRNSRAGVPIVKAASRIRRPDNGRPGTLSIAIDTTNSGDPTTIPHIIPAGDHFGFVTTKYFLVKQAWPIVRDREFPRMEQGLRIHDPEFDLRDYYIYFRVKATKEIDCLPDVNVDATVYLQFEALPKDKDGVQRTRLKAIYKDIHMDFWDQLFYTLLVGVLLGPLGVGVGVIGMIAFNVIIAVLEGMGETALGNKIQESSVGFRDKIPGTNIIVEASTPIAPTIYNDLIFGFGDAAFYPEP